MFTSSLRSHNLKSGNISGKIRHCVQVNSILKKFNFCFILPCHKYFNLDLVGERILTFSFCILSSCLEMHDIGQLRSFV